MELKYDRYATSNDEIYSINRTIFGIEIFYMEKRTHARGWLLIEPFLELKSFVSVFSAVAFALLIEPFLELKYVDVSPLPLIDDY